MHVHFIAALTGRVWDIAAPAALFKSRWVIEIYNKNFSCWQWSCR